MENITKQQFILVCLLVAIVTAITTSVSIISLIDDPSKSGLTIYQVIEKTIDKVADAPVVKNIVTSDTPKTPVVTQLSPSDIVDKNSDSVVRIYEMMGETKQFAALGIAVGTKDAIVASSLPHDIIPANQFVAITSDGRTIPLKFVQSGFANNFSLFTFVYDPKEKNKVPTISLKNINNIKLGSNIVAFGGKESGDVVSTGIVKEIKTLDDNASSTKNILLTDMALTSPISGWLLFDTSGNLIAFERGIDETDKTASFINAKLVSDAIATAL